MAQLLVLAPHPGNSYLFGRFVNDMLPLWGPRFEKITLCPITAPWDPSWGYSGGGNVEVSAYRKDVDDSYTHFLVIDSLESISDLVENKLLPKNHRNMLSIAYTLIDGQFINEKYLNVVSEFDFLVAPSYMARAAYREALVEASQTGRITKDAYIGARNMWYIPPAVDSSIYRPLNVHAGEYSPEELRQHFFSEKVAPEDFLILVSGNPTLKKGIPLAIQTVAHLKAINEKDPFVDGRIRAYLHMSPYRPAQGKDAGWIDIESLVIGNELELEEDIFLGYGFFDPETGTPQLSDQEMNYLYNTSDLVLDTSLKNSWNFTIAEAMSAGALVAGPNDFVTGEIIDSRGIELETSRFEWYPGRETSHTPDSYVRTIDPRESAEKIAEEVRRRQENSFYPTIVQSSIEETANEWLRLMGMI